MMVPPEMTSLFPSNLIGLLEAPIDSIRPPVIVIVLSVSVPPALIASSFALITALDETFKFPSVIKIAVE